MSGWPSVSSIPQRLEGEPGHMPVRRVRPGDLLGQGVPPPNVTSRDVDGELGDDGVLTNLEMLAGIGIPRIAPGGSR